jgi:aminoglycoside phosphotransferase (APT) family kinase protein
MKRLLSAALNGVSSYGQRYAFKMRRSGHLLNPTVLWRLARGTNADEVVVRFLRDEAANLFGDSSAGAFNIERPDAGHRSMLRIVSRDGKTLIIRVYPPNHKLKAEVHRDAANLLQKHGINAPRIRHYCGDLSKYGAFILVEDFISGERRGTTQLNDSNIKGAAKELAKLHAIHHPKWGWVAGERSGPMFPSLQRDIERYIAEVSKEAFGNDFEKVAMVRSWFDAWRPRFDQLHHFSLTHNDVHRNNGIFTPEGEYYMIDYATFEWSLPAQDVVRLEYRFLGSDPDRIAAFHRHYLQHLQPEEQERFREFYPFYQAYYQLRTAAKRTIRKSNRAGEPEAGNLKAWDSLVAMIEEKKVSIP